MSRYAWFIILLLVMATNTGRADTLRVGMSELDFPPFHYRQGGRLQGAAVEIVRLLAKDTGHTIEFQREPFERVKRRLKAGSLDMILIFFKTSARQEYALYLDEPYVYETNHLVVSHVPESFTKEYNGSLLPWKDYPFLSVLGYYHGPVYEHADYLKKHFLKDEKELIRRLLTERTFVGIGNKAAIAFHAQRMQVRDKIHFIEPFVDRSGDYLAFSRANPKATQYVREFNRALMKLKKTPEYFKIMDRYELCPE